MALNPATPPPAGEPPPQDAASWFGTSAAWDDLPAAERALARAVALSGGPHTRGQLSVAWRGLGGLYLWNGQLDRAEHAYRMAEEKADDVALTVRARRDLARLLRLRGHLDEAAKERNDGVWQTLKDHAEGMINRDTARLV